MASRDTSLNAIMTAESGGRNVFNYRYNENPSYYTASGYFQITNTTWREGASLAGVDTSKYPTAISAPYDVQRNVAGALFDQRGFTPWTSSAQTLAMQADSGDSSGIITGPTDGGGTGIVTPPATPTGPGGGTQVAGPGAGPTPPTTEGLPNEPGGIAGDAILAGQPGVAVDSPFSFGLTTGLAKALSDWLAGIEAGVGNAFKTAMGAVFNQMANFFGRFGLILIGLVVIGVALWRLADPDGKKTMTLVKAAAA